MCIRLSHGYCAHGDKLVTVTAFCSVSASTSSVDITGTTGDGLQSFGDAYHRVVTITYSATNIYLANI